MGSKVHQIQAKIGNRQTREERQGGTDKGGERAVVVRSGGMSGGWGVGVEGGFLVLHKQKNRKQGSAWHRPFQQSCSLRAAEQQALSHSTENFKYALTPHSKPRNR
eukprot:6197918-Pleurochrysis_carterae.AAC.1